MSINFSTHSEELLVEYKKVMDINNPINWLICGYSQGSDLKITATGDGGLEELKDEFEGSKIQYAFCRVVEPLSSLSRFILISWCGDGVQTSRKGLFHIHVNEVSQYFKGFHVHIQARNEDDIQPDFLMNKVKQSLGAQYSIQSQVPNPSLSKPAPKSVFKPSIAPPVKVAPFANNKEINESPKHFYPPATSSHEPIKLNPKPLGSSGAISGNFLNSNSNTIQSLNTPQVPKSSSGSIADRAKLFSNSGSIESISHNPNSKNSSNNVALKSQMFSNPDISGSVKSFNKTEIDVLQTGYQAVKLNPKPLYGPGVATKVFQPSDQETRERKSSFNASPRNSTASRIQEEGIKLQRLGEEKLRQQRVEEEKLLEQQKELIINNNLKSKEEELFDFNQMKNQVESLELNIHSEMAAIAMYDYSADEANEIDLVEGELIVAINKADEGWWEGTNSKGRRGFFPSNYVQLQAPMSNSSVPTIAEYRSAPPPQVGNEFKLSTPSPAKVQSIQYGQTAVALYEYDATEENEISFISGDLIVNIDMISDDWWSGRNARTNLFGLFPFNYVQLDQP